MNTTKNAPSTKDLLKRYSVTMFWVTVLVTMAFCIAKSINSYHYFAESTIIWLQNLSVILSATALYGDLGWKIQSWGGETPVEKHNKWIRDGLYMISLFLTILSFNLKA